MVLKVRCEDVDVCLQGVRICCARVLKVFFVARVLKVVCKGVEGLLQRFGMFCARVFKVCCKRVGGCWPVG